MRMTRAVDSIVWLMVAGLVGCSGDSKSTHEVTAAGSGGVPGLPPPSAAAGSGVSAAGTRSVAGISGASGTAGAIGSERGGSSEAAGSAGNSTGVAGAPAIADGPATSNAAGTGGGTAGASGTAGATTMNAGAAGSVASTCSGKPGAKRGKSTETVMAGGQRRTFVYYAPEKLDANQPVPLLIVPHGYTQSGQAMFDITKYPAIADREGFVVIFPDGAPSSAGPWEVGSNVCGNGAFVPGSGDDQAFIDQMIAFASEDQCIDKSHIFMSGWSMGGYLSNHSGCLREDIRAIGPHSSGTHDLSACKSRHKPVILFHFNPDGLIDYSCGKRARDSWVERNGCSMDAPETEMVKGGKCEYYKDCPADGQVAFCTFDIPANHTTDFLAGHAWSGGTVHSYSIAETESAAELGWKFFKKYAW